MAGASKEVDDATFQKEVMESPRPVLVDFWAQWCGPCQMMKPVVEKVAELAKDKFSVVTMEIDKNPQTAGKFNVMSIPTFIVVKEGAIKTQFNGALSEQELLKKVEEAIR